MRKYESIWIKLKLEKVCEVMAHPSVHRRIIKAVAKEKYGDVAYKVLWDAEGNKQPLLTVTVKKQQDHGSPNIIVFKLITPLSLAELL